MLILILIVMIIGFGVTYHGLKQIRHNQKQIAHNQEQLAKLLVHRFPLTTKEVEKLKENYSKGN